MLFITSTAPTGLTVTAKSAERHPGERSEQIICAPTCAPTGMRVKLRGFPFDHGLSRLQATEYECIAVVHQPFHFLTLLYPRRFRQGCGEIHIEGFGRAPLDPLNFDFMSHFFPISSSSHLTGQ